MISPARNPAGPKISKKKRNTRGTMSLHKRENKRLSVHAATREPVPESCSGLAVPDPAPKALALYRRAPQDVQVHIPHRPPHTGARTLRPARAAHLEIGR